VVITVSHSFIATANSIRFCNAEPVFVDIDLKTYNADIESLRETLERNCRIAASGMFYKEIGRLVTPESPLRYIRPEKKEWGGVGAILVVHQMGMPADMPSILKLARKYSLPVVEDAACAIGSEIRAKDGKSFDKIGKPHGDVACFSFHPRKIITTGDGGMLTTNNSKYDRIFRLLRHQGMSVSDLARHKAKRIVFEEYLSLGYNYRLTDIQAAIGLAQLRKLPQIIAKRRQLASRYIKLLSNIPWLALAEEPISARTNWQSFPVRLLKGAPVNRNRLMQKLLDQGITTRSGIMNAHEQKIYKNSKWRLPFSEKASRDVVLLPLFQAMEIEQINLVCEAIKNA
ncbi:MAG: DegT/DnrJ/EryC1/StrS family aminotransferase, partial [Candidatus Omnitrophica bacterium]|nr:DegT/DnrJ/EryC1/StrS family aminotransferase [Candidatus Omnitrophota bacterium]